jgi:hypothetical protein
MPVDKRYALKNGEIVSMGKNIFNQLLFLGSFGFLVYFSAIFPENPKDTFFIYSTRENFVLAHGEKEEEAQEQEQVHVVPRRSSSRREG